MVKKISRIFAVLGMLMLLAPAAFAASFTATVSSSNVTVGQGFTLQLSLSGASPKGTPDISALDGDFTIYGTSQSSQTTIINSKVSSSINWNVTLIPEKDGSLTIPALSIDTDAGTLTSDPIRLSAGKQAQKLQNDSNHVLFVDSQISKPDPYKNEPVLLTVKLVARRSISDVDLDDLTVENAIATRQGKPDIYDGISQGQRVKVIEVHYLVTPLKSGPVKIPGVIFHGKVETGQAQSPFESRFSDPFGMFQNFGNFPGFATYQPFAVSGNDIVLNVRPPAANIDPWLPAYMLKMTDEWTGTESAKVGEPLTRKLTIIAEGLSGDALPTLEDRVDPAGNFKVYSDKPTTGDNLGKDNQSVGGWRKESYTLIPQKAGTVTLPEIRLAWWDTLDNKISYATVPAKTITVKPGAPQAQNTAPAADAVPDTETPAASSQKPAPAPESGGAAATTAVPTYLYAALAGLGLVLVIMAGLVIHLLRKLGRHGKAEKAPTKTAPKAANQDKITLAGLKKAETPDRLRAFVQDYAHQHWGLPKNSSLQSIAARVRAQNPKADLSVFSDLDAALYAGGNINAGDAKKRVETLLKSIQDQPKNAGKKRKRLGSLNPS